MYSSSPSTPRPGAEGTRASQSMIAPVASVALGAAGELTAVEIDWCKDL
jgi:hypothetical protein